MTNEECDKYLWELYTCVNAAYMCQRVYWEFKNKNARRKYKAVFVRYGLFFLIGIHSHHVAVIMELCKVYENSKDTRNFFQLLKLLKKSGLMSKEDLASAEEKYKELKLIADKVRLLRNTIYAHLDAFQNLELIHSEVNLQYKDFETLIDGSLEIINILENGRGGAKYNFDSNPKQQVLEILEILNSK